MFASILDGFTYSLSLLGSTLEGSGPNQEQKWEHSAFALVISETLFKVVNQRLAHVLPEQVVIASVGVDLDEIKRRSSYVPWQSGVCKLYCCGRLNPVKGYVRLLCAVSEAEVRQDLEDAHLFALASLNEGIPVAVMEAMAMEMPAVVTDVGGTSELVDDQVDAILVQPENPEQMADAIVKILQNKELALRLSRESRKKIAAKFHHRVSAEALAGCLEAMKKLDKASQ